MGAGKEHGYVKVREESDVSSVRATTLVFPDGSIKHDGADEVNLLDLGTNWTEAALSTFTDLADAISELSADATIVVDEAAAVSTAVVVPESIFLRFAKGAHLTKSGSGTITFQGFGLEDPRSQVPIFEGFNAGDITWTGTNYPKRVSSELHYYAHDRLGERINFIDAALLGKYAIIELYPRTIDTTQAIVTENHHVEAMPGNYPNTWAVNFVIPILLKNNTSFRSNPPWGAIINESSSIGPNKISIIGAFMMEVPNAEGMCENIHVEYNRFVGNAGQSGSSGPSTVIIGNCLNGGINYNIFDRTHGYNVIGAFSTAGNHADNCTFIGNRTYGCGTQICAVINGRNVRIADNWFDQRDSNAGSAYTVLDVEPNISSDIAENIIIENNIFNITDDNLLSYAILCQGTTRSGPRNITVRNNTIFTGNMIPNTDTTTIVLPIGLSGVLEGYVYGNTIRGGQQAGISLTLCRNLWVWDNHVHMSYDATGLFSQILLQGISESSIYHNLLSKTSLWSATEERAGIYETEQFYVITTSGTQINLIQTIGWNTAKVYEWFSGLTVTINNTDYVVDDTTTNIQLDATTSIGTLPQIDFAPGDVDTGANTITETAHGHNTGSRVYLSTTGTLPGHTPPAAEPQFGIVFYYLIRVDANTLKLASTLANALAGTPIDLTSQGAGTHTISPVMKTKFSSNKYWDNEAPDGIHFEPSGTSFVVPLPEARFPALTGDVTSEEGSLETTLTDRVVTLPKLASGPINTVLGINAPLEVDPVPLTNIVGVTISGADNKQTKTASTGWNNAGAFSTISFDGDLEFEFTVTETNTYRVAGVSTDDTDQNESTIDLGWRINNDGGLQVWESGASPGGSPGSAVANTTVLTIRRIGTVWTYLKDGSLIYTSSLTISAPMFVDTALHDNGSTIGGIKFRNLEAGAVEALTDPIVTTLSVGSDTKLVRTGVSQLAVQDWSGNPAKLVAASLQLGGAVVLDVLTGTASLDFDLTSVVSQDLTITVTGAAVGDSVFLGIPHSAVSADIGFFAWISAADTCSVRAYRLAGTPDPASGTFRATVFKF